MQKTTDPRTIAAERLDVVWLALCGMVDDAVADNDIPMVIGLGELCAKFTQARADLAGRLEMIENDLERARR